MLRVVVGPWVTVVGVEGVVGLGVGVVLGTVEVAAPGRHCEEVI